MSDFPDRGSIPFRKLRDVGDVMNGTVALLRENWRELLTSYVAVVAPVALATGIATGLYMYQMGGLMADPAAIENDPFAMFGPTYLGILLFGFLGGALTVAAASAYVKLYREGLAGEITAGVLWEEARGLLLPFLGLSVVYALVVMASAVIAIVPCLGILAWMAFVVWSLPYYAVTIAVRTLEEDSLASSWQRARLLVKDSWGFSFGALLLAGLLFYVIILIISMPLYIVMMVVGINTIETDPTAMFSMMGAVMAPLQVVSYAGYLIPLVALYFVHGRLAEELDGSGLYADLDELAGLDAEADDLDAPDPTPPPAPGADAGDRDANQNGGGFRGGGFRG
ncbi:hypothetical protein [Rubrivirga marina]|uniref:Glycerophosphoryl diester phosphodiesterase membrane domain-containing protein n=1 Tax=Rubrivirga marina TaxID=1196024 RepID=A0A271J3E3_9BACT|nr:hypothetical protein [Rubrivirga marina]PAP77963.1 hypothetical protein BSZ37_16715 [Rubrivirga marina]